jgi:hypothetical protein
VHESKDSVRSFPLAEIVSIEPSAIERPGVRRVRATLKAMPERGWADPAIRSIWPGETQTNWVEVEIVRR